MKVRALKLCSDKAGRHAPGDVFEYEPPLGADGKPKPLPSFLEAVEKPKAPDKVPDKAVEKPAK